jgi:hypothetical protein
MGLSSMLSAINPYAGLIGAGVSALGQYRANRETRASTGRQIAFQERMSSTAHQRQMADLRKAGINPMLSSRLGGASSPSGASYQAGNIGAAAVEGYGKVSSAKQAQAQAKYTSGAQTELTRSQKAKVDAEIDQLIPAQAWNLNAQAKASNAAANLSDAKAVLTELQSTITNLDVQAFKAVSREIGLPVGPQTANTTIAAWRAASKNLDQLSSLASWGLKNIPLVKGWKKLSSLLKALKGK